MKESKEKMKKDHTMCFVILIGILVIFLGATIVYTMNLRKELENAKLESVNEIRTSDEKIENNNNTIINENTTLEETNKNENKKEPLKKDASKELVYTQISKKSSKDGYSFEIPYVNINSEYAEEINKEIKKSYPDINKLVKEAKKYGDVLTNISYKTYINRNILSLVIDNGESWEYQVYNIDIYTGKKVTNNEILKSKNVAEKVFLEKAGELSAKRAKEYNKDLSNEAVKETRKTNSNMKIKIFLNKQNNINIIPAIRTEAQWDPVEVIINTKL